MKQDILDYLRYTPANTNVNVVSTMLDQNNEIPPEVSNAVETGGLGWTDTEEKAGFDIQWDGNTEGLETISVESFDFYKVSDVLDIMNPIDNLIGANYIINNGLSASITEEDIVTPDNKMFALSQCIMIVLEDSRIGEHDISKGVWFLNSLAGSQYVSHFYKEATIEEVVHQIDQKYIPSGSGEGIPDAPIDGKQYARKDGAWSETGAYIVTFTHKGETYTADKTVDEINDVWYNKHLPVYAFIDNCMLPAVTVGRFDVMFGASGIGRTIEGSSPAINTVRLDNTGEVVVELNTLQRRLKAGDGITLNKDPHSSDVIISSTSSNKSAIIIPYASLGVTPYTFTEVKALLDAGNEVKVQTGSYIPHCTSYSNDIIAFFDITSWDLGAGVYSITYVHLRSNNVKYTYTEQEHLNPVVYTRIAPNYSATSDYTIGDYCTRYENIYRCTAAIIGGEEWNSSHWAAVTVMGEIPSDAHINSLIDAKLGVIENGTY